MPEILVNGYWLTQDELVDLKWQDCQITYIRSIDRL